MTKPKLHKRQYVPVCDFPVDEFLKLSPLPPKLAYLEPVIRGPLGGALLTTIRAMSDEGFDRAQMLAAMGEITTFYSTEYHRCNACFSWTNDPEAGAVLVDGHTFRITTICPKCAALVAAGKPTATMTKNMREFVLGGDA